MSRKNTLSLLMQRRERATEESRQQLALTNSLLSERKQLQIETADLFLAIVKRGREFCDAVEQRIYQEPEG